MILLLVAGLLLESVVTCGSARHTLSASTTGLSSTTLAGLDFGHMTEVPRQRAETWSIS